MDSRTFLADTTSHPQPRTPVLRLDDAPQTVRATPMYSEGEPMLLLRIWLDQPVEYAYFVVDCWGRIAAEATGHSDKQVDALIRERLAAKHVVVDDVERSSLLADHAPNGKRTSVVRSPEDDTMRVRAKLMFDEEQELVHIRAEFTDFGFIHVVIDHNARLCVKASGKTDSDTWTRVQGELNRMDYDLV